MKNNNEETLAYLKSMLDFNPVVHAVLQDSWLTTNGNRKVAYTFFIVLEDYSVTMLDRDLHNLFDLRSRKHGGVIFYPDQNPIASLSELLYDDATEIKVRWLS